MGAVEEDPFAIFLRPPSNESVGERAERLAQEAEAKKISDQIDEQLKAERAALKKQKDTVRVLLLGQSESGKSTTLKNFRMHYARESWEAERASWRAVIQLNVIRSIITIVETLQAEVDGEPYDAAPNTPSTPKSGIPSFALENPAHDVYNPNRSHGGLPPNSPAVLSVNNNLARSSLSSLLTSKHELLKVRLGPLRRVEADLQRRLGAASIEEHDGAAAGHGPLGVDIDVANGKKLRPEFSVRRLNDALQNSRQSHRGGSQHGHGSGPPTPGDASSSGSPLGDEPTEVLSSCLDDMKALWSDDAVRVVLKKRKVRLEETAGFFLDDLDRVVRRDYEPTDDDVVRARLRTLAVQEYRVRFEPTGSILSGGIGANAGKEWLLYDVGGSRTMRNAWIPFFDNIQAIIFLAPVSCFDERLSEDSRVNRLEDSFLLWRSICSSKLLARTCMILFLNKCDLLRKKLKAGVLVKKYLPSYGDRPNDPSSVVKYLREKFKEILRQHSPEPRSSYFYATSVVDTKATASTIKAVRDSILKDYLKSAELV
ncbi:G-protein alpha subunit [Crepidotus variabilis]|uniref:G-protein alpha subunit n=1 Tax=Crepidotus variabilis TaxID=179855 RepID=A0A9P6JP08_9AGAR|nr:G-protein alpha subunit [Crepidotus variabilis]